jgi:hypothetical protein
LTGSNAAGGGHALDLVATDDSSRAYQRSSLIFFLSIGVTRRQLIRERADSDPVIASIEAAHAAARNRKSELEVAFAFLGDWSGKTITSLPLFSRISMVNEARRVSNRGFTPTVALIPTR